MRVKFTSLAFSFFLLLTACAAGGDKGGSAMVPARACVPAAAHQPSHKRVKCQHLTEYSFEFFYHNIFLLSNFLPFHVRARPRRPQTACFHSHAAHFSSKSFQLESVALENVCTICCYTIHTSFLPLNKFHFVGYIFALFAADVFPPHPRLHYALYHMAIYEHRVFAHFIHMLRSD